MHKIKEANSLNWNIYELVEQMDNKNINFNMPIQRGFVWDSKRKSLFIHSILIGIFSSKFILNKTKITKDGFSLYECYDGKQRANAIYDFIKNKYSLYIKTPRVQYGSTIYTVAKHRFDDLHESLQNKIIGHSLDVIWYDNLTNDEKITIFSRINNGKPVTAADIARIKVKSRDVLYRLIKHPAIKEIIKRGAIERCQDEDIIKEIWFMCYSKNKNLTQSAMSPILETNEISKQQEEEIVQILNRMKPLYIKTKVTNKKLYQKIQNKNYITAIAYGAYFSIKNNIDEKDYIYRIILFFDTNNNKQSTSDLYNQSSVQNTSSETNVKNRMSVMEKVVTGEY